MRLTEQRTFAGWPRLTIAGFALASMLLVLLSLSIAVARAAPRGGRLAADTFDEELVLHDLTAQESSGQRAVAAKFHFTLTHNHFANEDDDASQAGAKLNQMRYESDTATSTSTQRSSQGEAASSDALLPSRSSDSEAESAELVDDYSAFPRVVGQIAHTLGVQSLRLGFTQGRWQFDNWGLEANHSPLFAPSAELQASFYVSANLSTPQQDSIVNQRWAYLRNALAGLLCASLNSIDESITHTPAVLSHASTKFGQDIRTLRGVLSHETVCTENLTPWRKLLPCRSQASLASLISGIPVVDTLYTSISVELSTACLNTACTQRRLTLEQTLLAVIDPSRSKLFALSNASNIRACPAARSSIVSSTFNVSGASFLAKAFQERIVVNANAWVSLPVPIRTQRFLRGSVNSPGHLVTQLSNLDSAPLSVLYQDVVPWFLPLYSYGLEVTTYSVNGMANLTALVQKSIRPSKLRGRPTVIELSLVLPANSTTIISVPCDRAFLHFTEYPADASRGFDIG
ncbi:hypothetical protein, variant [Capsaspora owczarzaki ATCC 30864]|nr:hypothetical protein, variant [Capsaspora owczarzaki ATCC 30864]